jgi:hydrogenase nickel incorporation protein HypB
MCTDCGCNEIGSISIDNVPDTLHTHSHLDSSGHIYEHSHPHEPHHHTHTIPVHQGILAKNDRIAEQNRQFLRDRGVLALNLLSSPGAGKTALIEKMAQDLPQFVGSDHQPLKMAVIVGDLATDNDAQRLRRAGAPAVQITTGNACHLEAAMVARAMTQITWSELDLLIIENVGNLVCPASYDLGETIRVLVLSVTEGEDKPLKYPMMFKTADVVLISKVDVTTAVGCDLDLAIENIQRIAPQAQLFQVSARTGIGLEDWYQYLITAMSENIISKKIQPEIAARFKY